MEPRLPSAYARKKLRTGTATSKAMAAREIRVEVKADPCGGSSQLHSGNRIGNHGAWSGRAVEGNRAGIFRSAGTKAGQQMNEAILGAYSQWLAPLFHPALERAGHARRRQSGGIRRSVLLGRRILRDGRLERKPVPGRGRRLSRLDRTLHAAGKAAGHSLRRSHRDLGRAPFVASWAGVVRTRH